MPDSPDNDLRLVPGGVVASKPPHMAGLRGATPFVAQPLTMDGFLNLVSLNGETAVPFANTADSSMLAGSLLLGGNVVGAGDCVDVARQNILGQHFYANRDVSFVQGVAGFNNEFILGNTGLDYGAAREPFTTAGTVTVVAGSPVFTGAGTAWLTDVLTNAYLAVNRKALNKIVPGDLIGVDNGAGARHWFRIITVTDATHLTVFPTPTAGNGAIGAGKAYQIIRTGYGGYSRGIPFLDDATGIPYWYYCGNSHNLEGSGQHGHGVVQAIAFLASSTNTHFMAPKTVDALGVETAFFPKADDIIYYKGYLLYGADTAISWTVAGFPTAFPFGVTDFPAANISVIDRPGKFVSFEQLGDQIVAHFEESHWLVVATGTVPEFNFYRMPETLGVLHPAGVEPCGCSSSDSAAKAVYGRPTCSGRGAIFYMSNRGIEQLSGGLSEEASEPISSRLPTAFPGGPGQLSTMFFSWSDDFDLAWIRPAWGESNQVLIYNPANKDWSVFKFAPTQGRSVVAITGGVPFATRQQDSSRFYHLGYYETLLDAGTPGTNGGISKSSSNSPDATLFQAGTVSWKWRTSTVPLGLRYPEFSLGGFLFDLITNGGASTYSWILYGGSSPYNMNIRDSNSFTIPAITTPTIFGTHWTSSRVRLGKKIDDPFVCIEISSVSWVQLAGVILFNANTQVKR